MVKFLILRFSSIGDIVLTTPVIRCIKQQVEGAEIHFATKEQFKTVVEHNPYIDKVHLLKGSMKQLIQELKTEDPHYIIDLHKNLRTLRIKQSLRLASFSFDKLNFKKWLLVQLKVNKMPNLHIVDRYLAPLSPFDVTNDNKGLDYFVPENEEREIILQYKLNTKKYVCVAVGAKHTTKQIPNEQLLAICRKLDEEVILLGGKEDVDNAQIIENELGNKVTNYAGKISLSASAIVLKHALCVLTGDTGLMHIASAYKKRIISIWGNTVPEFGMYPYLPGENSRIFEVKNLKCRPCSKIGYKTCPKKHFKCMNKHNVEKIALELNK